ncbi:MAG: MaoC family dehydratase [Oscillospiraceae bacterium]
MKNNYNCYTFSEISVGQKESFSVTITQEMMDSFRAITGDVNPLHADLEYAISKGYNNCVVYGMLTSSFLSTLAGVYLPGKYSLIHTVENSMLKPVFVSDTLTVTGEVKEKDDVFSTLQLKITIQNQNGEKVCRGKMRVGVTA